MEILIVRTGNSKGIRLSKTILKKYEIKDSVEVVTEKDFIVLKPKNIWLNYHKKYCKSQNSC
ncbi:MAG: antitoxin MazE [Spirosomataceae bacterium]|jgi:antitoxin MazE